MEATRVMINMLIISVDLFISVTNLSFADYWKFVAYKSTIAEDMDAYAFPFSLVFQTVQLCASFWRINVTKFIIYLAPYDICRSRSKL